MNWLISVTGYAGIGKSTFAKNITEFIPGTKVLSFDQIKVDLWEKHGFKDKEDRAYWSQKGLEILFDKTEDLIQMGQIPILDWTMHKNRGELLTKRFSNVEIITVKLLCPPKICYERFTNRDRSSNDRALPLYCDRYMGPNDVIIHHDTYEEWLGPMLEQQMDSYYIGRLITVDAEIPENINLSLVAESIKEIIMG